MLKSNFFYLGVVLLMANFPAKSQAEFKALEVQQKVDDIMGREVETDADITNGGLSIYYKKGKQEYNCDFRIQDGVKKSSCDGLQSILPKIQFVSRRNFKFSGWYEGDLSYDLNFPNYLDISKDVKKKGWYLTNKMNSFRIQESYVEDEQEGDVTYIHKESGTDNILYQFEDEANLINPSKFSRKYDRQQIHKGNYTSYYANGKRRTKNTYQVEKNTFLKQNTVKANITCEVEVTVFGTYSKWYESGRKFYEVVYDETYMKNYLINEGKHQDESMTDGKLKGKYTAWHENGQLMCQGVLKNGKREGSWKFYDLNGFVVERINYLNGKIKGEYVAFYINGEKRQKVNYYNDFKVGLGYTYHQNGKIATKTEYIRGEKFGLYQEFDDEGHIVVNGYYNRNKKVDKWEAFYDTGKLRELKFFKLGLLHGIRNKFFASGEKSLEAKYESGKTVGEFTTWFNNGIKNVYGKFHKGMKNGTWYKFFKSGVKKELVNYALASATTDTVTSIWYENYELKKEPHLRNGKCVKYHFNGQKRFEGNFTNGRLDGQQLYYDTSGVVVRKEMYVAGERRGDVQKYYDNGRIKLKGNYADDVNFYIEAYFNEKGVQTIIAGKGVLLSEKSGYKKKVTYEHGAANGIWQSWYPSGELMEEGVYERGEQTGTYTKYNKDSSVQHHGDLTNGLENGHWKHYSKKGVLLEKGKYKDGVKTGKWMYYYKNGKPKEKLEYLNNGTILVLDYWNKEGDQRVVNGFGEYVTRDENGVKIKGMLANGLKEGQWSLAIISKDVDYVVLYKKGRKVKF